MKIVFFGSSKFVLPILEVLRKNYDLALVLTTETPIASQGLALRSYAVIAYCKGNNIPYLSVQAFDQNLKSLILNLQSPLGVLAYFGLILPKEILNLFPLGILNVHPSLLPKYRGPTPGQTAILNGEKITGVTIIKLDEEVDHGPILTQVEEPISQNDNSETLYSRLFATGARLLEKTIELYLNNKSVLKEQEHSKAKFTHHLSRQNGFIDLSNPPSPEKLNRMIRAYYPWPGVWTLFTLQGDTLRGKIVKFLPEQKIQVESKKPISYKDFVNGYPQVKQLLAKLGILEEK